MIKCDNEKKEEVKDFLEKEYTAIASKEMLDILEEECCDCDEKVGLYWSPEGRNVSFPEVDFSDEDEWDEDDYAEAYEPVWSFEHQKITSFGVNIESVEGGLFITYKIPAYVTNWGDCYAGRSKAMETALRIIKNEFSDISYYGYEGYFVSDIHSSNDEQAIFCSDDEERNNIDEFIGLTLKDLWQDTSFWKVFSDVKKDEKKVLEIIQRYQYIIGENALDIYYSHINNGVDKS